MRCEEFCSEEVGVESVYAGCVPVAFADDMERAEQLQWRLERCRIPAFVDGRSDLEDLCATLGRGVGVFVPEQMHDRASAILAEDDERDVCVMDGTDDEDEGEDDDFLDDDDDEDYDDLDDLDDDDYDEDDDEDDDDLDFDDED